MARPVLDDHFHPHPSALEPRHRAVGAALFGNCRLGPVRRLPRPGHRRPGHRQLGPVVGAGRHRPGRACARASRALTECAAGAGAAEGDQAGRVNGCSMLTRLPSVSMNDTYWPMPGISIGSPSTFAAGRRHLLHRGADVVHRDHDRGVLRRPVGLALIEAAIDRAGRLDHAIHRFGGVRHHVVAHLLAQHLGLPAEGGLVEGRHALAVVIRHFKMNDGIHGEVSLGGLCGQAKRVYRVAASAASWSVAMPQPW
jgi:hypothetical protein